MANALGYLGIAKKAGALEIGETNSGSAVRSGAARLLMLAADASDNARSRAENFVYGRKTPLIRLPYTKTDISSITGVNGCSMAAFTDIGLAAAFISSLARDFPEHRSIAAALEADNEKMKKRKSETAAGIRNKKIGKTAVKGMRRKKQ